MAKLQLVDLDEFRDTLTRERNPIALCGAGVSIPAPSGLPSGNELRDLAIANVLRDRENASLVDRLLRHPGYRALLPEAALQEAGYFVQRAVERFVARLLRDVPSNHLHAEISRRFPLIFTTNFDLCLENSGCANVSHLHGSIERPESLQTRLWRLGRTAIAELERFRASLDRHSLFVAGYSMRDSDILAALKASREPRILYLSHTQDIPKTLFSLPGDITYAIGSLDALWALNASNTAVTAQKPVRVRQPAKADKALALLFLFETCGMMKEVEETYDLYRGQLRGRPLLRSTAILAETWRSDQRFADAKTLCESLMRRRGSKHPRNLDLASWVLTVLALCEHEGASDLLSARRHLIEALIAINRYGRKYDHPTERDRVAVWRAKIANNLGNVERDRYRYKRAKTLYEYSISVKRRYGEEAAVAQTLSNWAVMDVKRGELQHALVSMGEVVAIMTKTPESYVCKSAIFDIATSLVAAQGLPVKNLRFDAVDLRGLEEVIRERGNQQPLVLQLITKLGQLDEIRAAFG